MNDEPHKIYGPITKNAPFLLVGEAPSRNMKLPDHCLLREDLMRLAGLDLRRFYSLFARTNLLDYWPGRMRPGHAGDKFPLPGAREAARKLVPALPGFELTILLGRRVERAFGFPSRPWFEVSEHRARIDGELKAFRVACFPHPSKASRWWNKPGNLAKARSAWRHAAAIAATRLDERMVATVKDLQRRII